MLQKRGNQAIMHEPMFLMMQDKLGKAPMEEEKLRQLLQWLDELSEAEFQKLKAIIDAMLNRN